MSYFRKSQEDQKIVLGIAFPTGAYIITRENVFPEVEYTQSIMDMLRI